VIPEIKPIIIIGNVHKSNLIPEYFTQIELS